MQRWKVSGTDKVSGRPASVIVRAFDAQAACEIAGQRLAEPRAESADNGVAPPAVTSAPAGGPPASVPVPPAPSPWTPRRHPRPIRSLNGFATMFDVVAVLALAVGLIMLVVGIGGGMSSANDRVSRAQMWAVAWIGVQLAAFALVVGFTAAAGRVLCDIARRIAETVKLPGEEER